jgi:hypothetical protein
MYVFFAEFTFCCAAGLGMNTSGQGNNDDIQNQSVSGGRCKVRDAREGNAQSG